MELAKWDPTLHGLPWRAIKGVKPDALKGASPVLNGGDEETGLSRPRLVATQLECANFLSLLGSGARIVATLWLVGFPSVKEIIR